jgi:hypothetical protein
MVKTHQLMRWLMYPIPALDATIRGFFAIFCHLRSRVNQIFLRLVARYRNSTTNEAPGPATRPEPHLRPWPLARSRSPRRAYSWSAACAVTKPFPGEGVSLRRLTIYVVLEPHHKHPFSIISTCLSGDQTRLNASTTVCATSFSNIDLAS